MIDAGIYSPLHVFPSNRRPPKPANLDELQRALSARRPSLSSSQFTEEAFDAFQLRNKTPTAGTVKRAVVPILEGNPNPDILTERDLHFTNIMPITGATTVKAVPDCFDGVGAGAIEHKIRSHKVEGNLNNLIVPTKHPEAPVAPNFFLESKAPGGNADVARRQALHDGAIGARAMHALQNYGLDVEAPIFDGNAYAYSATYQGGTLYLYAHHVMPSSSPDGGTPQYYMTALDMYGMGVRYEKFVEGSTAFRNLREWAHRQRDTLVQAANARARQLDGRAVSEAEITVATSEQGEEESTFDEFVDCEDESKAAGGNLEDEESPQRQSQELASRDAADPAVSSATSLPTSLASDSGMPNGARSRPKRRRASRSPPLDPQPQKRPGSAIRRTLRSATQRKGGPPS